MQRFIRIDKRFVFCMFISLAAHYVKISETALNEPTPKPPKVQNSSLSDNNYHSQHEEDKYFDPTRCNNATKCSELPYACLKCYHNTFKEECNYGDSLSTECEPKNQVNCIGELDEFGREVRKFKRAFICRYCFLTEPWEHDCKPSTNCNSASSTYRTNCTVKSSILCFGSRNFPKNVPCNWTRGSKYFTALILSITLGGFGVDRFYLGFWQEGIGKLFSFGGIGVWVIVDAILISIGYLGTSDGSLLL